MNRQRGASSLLLVLLLFAMASALLQGTHRQYRTLLAQVSFEQRALMQSAQAESLLQWGKQAAWRPQAGEQCQQSDVAPGVVCLRLFADGGALLAARSGEQRRWQSGTVSEGRVRFSPRGWSDFCPRKEVSECDIP